MQARRGILSTAGKWVMTDDQFLDRVSQLQEPTLGVAGITLTRQNWLRWHERGRNWFSLFTLCPDRNNTPLAACNNNLIYQSVTGKRKLIKMRVRGVPSVWFWKLVCFVTALGNEYALSYRFSRLEDVGHRPVYVGVKKWCNGHVIGSLIRVTNWLERWFRARGHSHLGKSFHFICIPVTVLRGVPTSGACFSYHCEIETLLVALRLLRQY